jgi:hypothetical protein
MRSINESRHRWIYIKCPSAATGYLLTGYVLTPDKEIVVSSCFGQKLGDCNEITKRIPAHAAGTIADFIAGKIGIDQLRRSNTFIDEWKGLTREYKTLKEFYDSDIDIIWQLTEIGLSCETQTVPHGNFPIEYQELSMSPHFYESFRISWKKYE